MEAPSQMLENWTWEPKILAQISSHYKTNEPLPADLITKLIKRFATSSVDIFTDLFSRYVNVGLFYLRQIFFAKFDMTVHTEQGQPVYYAKHRADMK